MVRRDPGSSAAGPQRVQVAVNDVHVRYEAPSDETSGGKPRRGLRHRLLGKHPTMLVRALKGVSLVAHEGEAIGLVGLNGSGKSTLLRIVAGLEPPTQGGVLASSSPVLLGVSAAMVPNLSGRENVRLGCLAMGMTPAQTAEAMPDILDLSGIGSAIHRPMSTYSSGMGARLRFAIAAASRPEILLIDEALATGDAAFRARSEERMNQLRANAGCVFLVSHAAQTVEETCTRAVWLHSGRVVLDGPARAVARRYRAYAWNLAKGKEREAEQQLREAFLEGADTEIVVRTPDHGHRRGRREA